MLDGAGEGPCKVLGSEWGFSLARPEDLVSRKILEIQVDADFGVAGRWIDTRPIPEDDGWFENVWKEYEQDRVIRREAEDE